MHVSYSWRNVETWPDITLLSKRSHSSQLTRKLLGSFWVANIECSQFCHYLLVRNYRFLAIPLVYQYFYHDYIIGVTVNCTLAESLSSSWQWNLYIKEKVGGCTFYTAILFERDEGKPYLTIRSAARKGYGSIAHEAKPNELLTRGPWGRRV